MHSPCWPVYYTLAKSGKLHPEKLHLPTDVFELQTFRTQDLSFPRTKGPYRELSFPRNESSRNFRSRERKVSGTKVPHRDYSFLGTKGLGHEKSWYHVFDSRLKKKRYYKPISGRLPLYPKITLT